MSAALAQTFFIPKPTFTENELPDQTGKVHIVTGGYAGVGEELAKIFYSKNATVYVAGRSKSKFDAAIDRIKKANPDSKGTLSFLAVDLADLATLKPAAEAFQAKESRLDTLTNNAGVMNTPPKQTTVQGHELQIGTNCLGPWLFTHHLLPILKRTAAKAPKNSVRVTWASSLAIWGSPRDGVAFSTTTQSPKVDRLAAINYCQSKAGNYYMASEFARRYGKDGIVSVSWNPGNLKTELQRHTGFVQNLILRPVLHSPKMGAYTELYAACSLDITIKDGGTFIAPWGRKFEPRADLKKGTKDRKDGGSGVALKFWDWCDKESRKFQS